jgi:hypothetical protein
MWVGKIGRKSFVVAAGAEEGTGGGGTGRSALLIGG